MYVTETSNKDEICITDVAVSEKFDWLSLVVFPKYESAVLNTFLKKMESSITLYITRVGRESIIRLLTNAQCLPK